MSLTLEAQAARRRRRPGHKPCAFMLMVTHGLDGVIRWGCPGCGEQGYISNWQRTGLYVTPDEHKLLTDIITCSQEEDAIISGAVSTSEGVRLSGREDDFDQFPGSIAFDINHCENSCRERILGTKWCVR